VTSDGHSEHRSRSRGGTNGAGRIYTGDHHSSNSRSNVSLQYTSERHGADGVVIGERPSSRREGRH
jgi:hypothetical protein